MKMIEQIFFKRYNYYNFHIVYNIKLQLLYIPTPATPTYGMYSPIAVYVYV